MVTPSIQLLLLTMKESADNHSATPPCHAIANTSNIKQEDIERHLLSLNSLHLLPMSHVKRLHIREPVAESSFKKNIIVTRQPQ